jgi:hypothetical protein
MICAKSLEIWLSWICIKLSDDLNVYLGSYLYCCLSFDLSIETIHSFPQMGVDSILFKNIRDVSRCQQNFK